MTYPPPWRHVTDLRAAIELMRAHPFAHLFSAHQGLRSTRAPFLADEVDGRPARLRAHLNAQNPQAEGLDGAAVLITFSGPSTYVSPHWRSDASRAGTYDYEEAVVRGVARVVDDIAFFRSLIDDLSTLIEPQYAEVGDYPVWRTSMAPEGYIERLFPHVTPFEVDVEAVEVISKLHQQFPIEDRRSVAGHLARCGRDDARAIGEKMRKMLNE